MRKSSTTQRRKQLVSIMVVGILILVLAVAGIGIHIISKYIPSKEQMNLTEYYGQPAEGEMVLVLGTDIMEERCSEIRRSHLSSAGYRKHLFESRDTTGTVEISRFYMRHRRHLRSFLHQKQEMERSGCGMERFI